MMLSTPLLTVMSRCALAGTSAAFLLAMSDAQAAGPRPLFQMPVPCGQTWDLSTYEKHWNGDQDALDLAQRDADLDNLSEGEPALASAAGTVSEVYTSGNGEHRVFLDHGDGWKTAYVHLETLPPLTVGQSVAQGQMVGRISNSGSATMHLHYNQFRDGETVRASFNGKLVKTHAGDKDTWDTWGTDKSERLTSLNCPGNAFVPFNLNGMRYQLLYKPATGAVKTVRLKPDGKGTTSVWSATWSQRWTHLAPFHLVGGQQHLITYKASTGEVGFHRFNSQGKGTTTLARPTWYKGWTHITPFSLGGRPYLLVYDSLNGFANIERVNAEGSGTKKIYGSIWTRGWTHFLAYELGPTLYMLRYAAGTGAARVSKLTGSGDNVVVTEVWAGRWPAGWSQLVVLKHKGARHLFAYRAATGRVSYGKLRAGGRGSQTLGSATWTTAWTAFTPFLQDGVGGLFAYKAGVGTAHTRLLNTAGSSSVGIWTGAWTKGWA